MPDIDMIFDRLDMWRHLPKYQLERRADIYFSLYIAEVLDRRFGKAMNPTIIPEFPIRKGLLSGVENANDSTNMDFLAVTASKDLAFFVELKTDIGSRRKAQDTYLQKARNAELPMLLESIKPIIRKTKKKRKYLQLLISLEEMGFLRLPVGMKEFCSKPSLVGITKLIENIEVCCANIPIEIVYIQPTGEGDGIINFKEFAALVRSHNDPLSQRFAESLMRWAETIAGYREKLHQLPYTVHGN